MEWMQRGSHMTTTEICKRFSDNLKRIRREKGISLLDFADKSGISIGCINGLLYKKEYLPTSFTLVVLAETLDVDPVEFFKPVEEKKEMIREEEIEQAYIRG